VSPSLALVIPVLNEREQLPGLLDSARHQSEPFDEIVVSDGGSTDGTSDIAAEAGAIVVASDQGRGEQIATGVAATKSSAVLVLHADSRCQRTTVEAIKRHFSHHPESPGGCLGHRFDRRSWLLRLVEWADRRRARRGISYGDQGQFFRKDALNLVGGFPRQRIMEDVELSRRLQSIAHPVYLDVPVTCSSRGFDRLGVLGTIVRNRRLRSRYRRLGASALEDLHRRYYPASNAATRSTTS
jgi:rSAM/selenodomain-associated transferase 2